MIDHGSTKSGRVDAAPTQSPFHGAGWTGRVCRRPSWASPPTSMIDHGSTKSGRIDAAPTQSPFHGAGRTGRVCRRPSWASPPVPFSM